MFDVDENIIVPENIDDYIRKGIALGVKKKKVNKIKLMANAAVISILTLFTVSVRTSPAFAAYIAKVPGLEYLVRFINYDKGLQDAIENNFIQSINSSVTKEGIKFTIKDVIIDNSQALIFYSIENQRDDKNIQLAKISLSNEKGEVLIVSTSWGGSRPYEAKGDNKIEDRIDVNFLEGTVLPDKLSIEVKLREETFHDDIEYKESVLDSSWNYEIAIDKEKIKDMEKSYALNEVVEIEGQKITFKGVKITPTRISVEVEYDENNSKKIFGYDDITIVDEKAENWGTIMNGFSGSRKDENHETLYFQSNYFNIPKNLYIRASSVRALDKDKLNAVVDLENNKLLKTPNENLTLKQINKTEKEISIMFSMQRDKSADNNTNYFIFSGAFKDSNGNTYNQKRCETWTDGITDETKTQIINFVIDNDTKIKGPVYLNISDYPERIKGEFKVKIK
jgi:hypothetical protein